MNISFLKSSLISTKVSLLYLMPANLALHMPQLPFDMIINKYHCYVNEHFILTSVLVIVSYSVSIEEDNLGVLC